MGVNLRPSLKRHPKSRTPHLDEGHIDSRRCMRPLRNIRASTCVHRLGCDGPAAPRKCREKHGPCHPRVRDCQSPLVFAKGPDESPTQHRHEPRAQETALGLEISISGYWSRCGAMAMRRCGRTEINCGVCVSLKKPW